MSFSLAQILGLIVTYLGLLFAVGYLADRGVISEKISSHPAVFVLSLGVFAGSLAINGAVQMAFDYGYSYLLYYVGVVIMFMLAPLLIQPVYRICRLYQLGSLADLLVFRFRSQWVGSVVTLVMLGSLMPLLAMQIKVVSDSIHLLAGQDGELADIGRHPESLAFVFCAIITLFTMLFGARKLPPNQQHRGLVTAIAFESLLKLLALLALGVGTIYTVFGGFGELDAWLLGNPQYLEMMDSPLRQDASRGVLLTFFAGALVMPHMFHMAITENTGGGKLRIASWGLPLYLMLLSLPILPITWAVIKLDTALPVAHGALAIGLEQGSALLTLYAFFAGLSAASAVIIVSTLALANMSLNHLVLPTQLRRPTPSFNRGPDLHLQLRWLRRILIAAIILAGYLYYRVFGDVLPTVTLGLSAFSGVLQLMPAAVAAIYWPGANRHGLLAGLLGGISIWLIAMMFPLFADFDIDLLALLPEESLSGEEGLWTAVTVVSLAINTGLFLLVSTLTPTSEEERINAEICSMDDLNRPLRKKLQVTSVGQFKKGLAKVLGEDTAGAEVDNALRELHLREDEGRPYALRQLRARLEANLSGLLGPAVAWDILQRCIPLRLDTLGNTEDISLIEQRLDDAQIQFTGLAADLDNLRRYHRETLQQLPIGVLSLGRDGEVLMWNHFMEQLTGVNASEVVGSYLDSIPASWAVPLQDFASSSASADHRLEIGSLPGQELWVSLHKAVVESSSRESEDQVIVVEDLTDHQRLENELLHSERLASIGRLAAGVAHEIGNPVTGISSLAQNLAYEDELPAVRDAASDILKQTDRVSRIVESLVNFSHTGKVHGSEPTLQPLNVADCADEAIHLLELDKEAREIEFRNRCNREHLVMADSQKLLQVFVNLLGNARDASETGQAIDIDSSTSDSLVLISVTDQGAGIPEDIQGQIFEPFFTTKDTGEGTGLGLALVYSIMEDLQGRIHLESPLEGGTDGTRFTVEIARGEYRDEYS